MEIAQTGIALIGLGANSLIDLQKKEVSLVITLLYGICGVLLRIVGGFDGRDFVLALLPGAVCMLLSFVTKGQIGYGDAWILLATGCCMRGADLLMVCMLALAGAGLVALFLLVVFRKKGSFEFPFVPFLLAGVICVRCIGL
jgi:leader peptidase (prepilin peptidase)/N-methyltransferase